MTKRQGKSGTIDIIAVLAEDEEFLRALVRMALQVLEAEMREALCHRQVGAKGWSCPIEGRDANFDLSSARPPTIIGLVNFAHTTFSPSPRN